MHADANSSRGRVPRQATLRFWQPNDPFDYGPYILEPGQVLSSVSMEPQQSKTDGGVSGVEDSGGEPLPTLRDFTGRGENSKDGGD